MPKIRLKNLTKIYGDRPQQGLRMLDAGKSNKDLHEAGHPVGCIDVTFDVQEGELLVVMGLSGSGKSTLIRCFNLLNSVTRGHLYVDGEDITQYGREQLLDYRRRKISMVFQHFALFPFRTVTDNAAYGLEMQGVPRDVRRARAREALVLVGLKGWEEAYPGQLSGGMQQRVGLARALAVESDILLMDEAFSALDPLIRRDMQRELMQLQQKMKKTIIFITHDLDEALQLGDRIVLMKDGRVVQTDTPEQILSNPANEYVKRFVEHVDLSRVLPARAAMVSPQALVFERDGARTALHKMNEVDFTVGFVVQRDFTYCGTIGIDQVEKAVQARAQSMEGLYEKTPPIRLDTPLSDVITKVSTWPFAEAVVDKDSGKLLGIVTRTSVLTVLANNAQDPDDPGDGDGAAGEGAGDGANAGSPGAGTTPVTAAAGVSA